MCGLRSGMEIRIKRYLKQHAGPGLRQKAARLSRLDVLLTIRLDASEEISHHGFESLPTL